MLKRLTIFMLVLLAASLVTATASAGVHVRGGGYSPDGVHVRGGGYGRN